MVAIVIILAAVIAAFVFSPDTSKLEKKTVNVTVSSVEILNNGWPYSSSYHYRVGFTSGDIIVFGKDVYLSEDIKSAGFTQIVVPGESYRMTYTRSYKEWTLVGVRPPDK